MRMFAAKAVLVLLVLTTTNTYAKDGDGVKDATINTPATLETTTLPAKTTTPTTKKEKADLVVVIVKFGSESEWRARAMVLAFQDSGLKAEIYDSSDPDTFVHLKKYVKTPPAPSQFEDGSFVTLPLKVTPIGCQVAGVAHHHQPPDPVKPPTKAIAVDGECCLDDNHGRVR